MAVLDVLADPVRRRLCEHLRDGEASAGTLVALISDEFGISQPATSRHLRLLREAGVVRVRSESTSRWYALDRAALADAGAWFAQFDAAPTPALDALSTEIARGKRTRRQASTQPTQPTEETA
jgi:DNA-binding transcriptional ArsR family regulator